MEFMWQQGVYMYIMLRIKISQTGYSFNTSLLDGLYIRFIKVHLNLLKQFTGLRHIYNSKKMISTCILYTFLDINI